jgi:hypothetical protein
VHVFGRGQSTTRQDLARAEFVESIDHFRQAATHAAGGLGATVGPKVGMGMNMARDKMGSARGYVGSARGYVGPGTARMTQAASRGWDTTIAFVMPLADAARTGSVRAAMLPEGAAKLSPAVKSQILKAQALRTQALRTQAHRIQAHRTQAMKKQAAADSSNGHMATAMVSIVAAGAALGATGALVARRRNRSKWAEYEPAALQDDAQAFVDQTRSASRSGVDGPRTASKMAGWAKEHSRSAVDGVRGKMHDSSTTSAGSHMDDMTSRPGPMGDERMGSERMGGEMGDASGDSTPADPTQTGSTQAQSMRAEPMPGKGSDAADRTTDSAHHMADKADAKLNDAAPRRGSKPSTKSTDANETSDDAKGSNKNGRQQQ